PFPHGGFLWCDRIFTEFHPISTLNNTPNVGAGAAVSHRTHQPVIYTRPFPGAVFCGAID
ncbi:hypothetical protein, partial [Limnospira platensis]|uniref:hypothetical protein n=1 Tax=Limnospira platensis TaxID=118562 RepID=UPI003D6FA367